MNRYEIYVKFYDYIESMRGWDLAPAECEKIVRDDMKTFKVSLNDFEVGCLVQWICS